MATYLVRWDIHIEAETPEQAARDAKAIQARPNSTANVFKVYGPEEDEWNEDHGVTVDLDEPI